MISLIVVGGILLFFVDTKQGGIDAANFHLMEAEPGMMISGSHADENFDTFDEIHPDELEEDRHKFAQRTKVRVKVRRRRRRRESD